MRTLKVRAVFAAMLAGVTAALYLPVNTVAMDTPEYWAGNPAGNSA
jgi:hypothetical protein